MKDRTGAASFPHAHPASLALLPSTYLALTPTTYLALTPFTYPALTPPAYLALTPPVYLALKDHVGRQAKDGGGGAALQQAGRRRARLGAEGVVGGRDGARRDLCTAAAGHSAAAAVALGRAARVRGGAVRPRPLQAAGAVRAGAG